MRRAAVLLAVLVMGALPAAAVAKAFLSKSGLA